MNIDDYLQSVKTRMSSEREAQQQGAIFTGSSIDDFLAFKKNQFKKPSDDISVETRNENVLLGNEPLEISGTLKMDDLEKNPAYTNA